MFFGNVFLFVFKDFFYVCRCFVDVFRCCFDVKVRVQLYFNVCFLLVSLNDFLDILRCFLGGF